MGNCSGHTGVKNGNKNVRKTKSKQGNTEFIKTTLSNKLQETNQEKLNSGAAALKSKKENRNKKNEMQNRKGDTERVVTASEPVAHHTKNQGAQQEDNNGHLINITNDSSTKYQEDSLTAETRNEIQEQGLTKSRRKTSKYCDKNGVENTKENLDFNTKAVGEKRSHYLERTDRTKCSKDSVNISDNMKKSSTICTKRFVESDEDEESFEKLVVCSCFSENVKKAFVELSDNFAYPQQNVDNMDRDIKITNKGEKLQEKSKRTFKNGYDIDPHKDVKCSNSNMNVNSERTNQEQPLQEKVSTFAECYPPNAGIDLSRESPDLIDDTELQKNVGKIFATDDNVKYLNFGEHAHNVESNLTECLGENEKTDGNKYSNAVVDPAGNVEISSAKTDNDLDPVKNITENEQAFNKELSVCIGRVPDNSKEKNFDPDSTDLEVNNESTKMKNELDKADDANGKHKTGPINVGESLACLSITNKNEMNMIGNVPDKEQTLNEESIFSVGFTAREQMSSTSENELSITQDVQHNKQSLNEDIVFTKDYSEKEETGFCTHNTDFNRFESNTNKMASDENVPNKKQSSNKNLNSPESSSAEKDDTNFSKNSSYFNVLEDNQVISPASHENVLNMDQIVYDKVQSPAIEDVGFDKESSDITDLKSNLVSSPTANTNEFKIHKDTRDIGFTKEGIDTIDLEINLVKSSLINEDGLGTDKYVPDTQLRLKDDSGFTEYKKKGFCKHCTNPINLPQNLVISCSTQENGLNINKKFSDEETKTVVITDKDCTPEHMFVIDQKNKCLILDRGEDSAASYDPACFPVNETTEKKARNGNMNENVNSEHEIESVKESTLYKIESLSIRNELNKDEHVLDMEKHLSEDSSFPGNCSENKRIEKQTTKENMYGSLNSNQENKSTNECLFDICKEHDLYDTKIFTSHKRNDESLSEICEDSGLYEIVSLPTEDENEFCPDKKFRENELLVNKESVYFGCCFEHEEEMQKTNRDKRSNQDQETASAHENLFRFCEKSASYDPENFNTDEKSDVHVCLPDVYEDSSLYETLSYCKINRGESCDCFEEINMDCCCQCCECIENRD